MGKEYHSIDWGFDVELSSKRKKSNDFLNRIQFPHVKIFFLSFKEMEKTELFNGYKYLVIVTCGIKKRGYFNISTKQQLILHIKTDFRNAEKDIEITLIEQLDATSQCYTANIFSNGMGDLFCEVLKGTVDNRELTNIIDRHNRTIYSIEFSNYSLIKCEDFCVYQSLYRYLKDCLYFRGYYELSYANLHGDSGVYFTFYSNSSIYQNIFHKDVVISQKELEVRCLDLMLREHGISYLEYYRIITDKYKEE